MKEKDGFGVRENSANTTQSAAASTRLVQAFPVMPPDLGERVCFLLITLIANICGARLYTSETECVCVCVCAYVLNVDKSLRNKLLPSARQLTCEPSGPTRGVREAGGGLAYPGFG